jgi:NTE family protein
VEHQKKKIDLALQGGGAHGAFTWGMLDRLLEKDIFIIEGISATSAGSMNAIILAQGMMDGGPHAARQLLEKFWKTVSEY